MKRFILLAVFTAILITMLCGAAFAADPAVGPDGKTYSPYAGTITTATPDIILGNDDIHSNPNAPYAYDPVTATNIFKFEISGQQDGIFVQFSDPDKTSARVFVVGNVQIESLNIKAGDAYVHLVFDGPVKKGEYFDVTTGDWGLVNDKGQPQGISHLAIWDDPAPVPPGKIAGIKYWDANVNGTKDADEVVLSGVTFQLWEGDTLIGTTTSNADGYFEFNELDPEKIYNVKEVMDKDIWYPVNPSTGEYRDAAPVQDLTEADYLYFGNAKYGGIEGFKYLDINHDQTGNIGILGWKITLNKLGDSSVNETFYTDARGHYAFNHLKSGVYTVTEGLQNAGGWINGTNGITSHTVYVDGSGIVINSQNFYNDYAQSYGTAWGGVDASKLTGSDKGYKHFDTRTLLYKGGYTDQFGRLIPADSYIKRYSSNEWGMFFQYNAASGSMWLPLMAGQSTEMGYVTVSKVDDTHIQVTFDLNDNWTADTYHLYVGTSAPGTMSPGQFPYSSEISSGKTLIKDGTVTIEFAEGTPASLYVAAHCGGVNDHTPPAIIWE